MECGAKEESEKKIRRKRGREGATRSFALNPPPPPQWLFFLLLASLCGVPTIRTPGTDYFADPRNTVLWIKCSQLYSSFHVSKVLLHSLQNSTQCSDNIWDNFYTLHLPQPSFSFQKHKFSVLMLFLAHSDFFGMRYQNHFDSAGQRDRSRWERELQLFYVFVIINKLYFIFGSCAVRFAVVFGESFAWSFCTTSVASVWLPIRAHKSFHRCVLCSNFRWPFSTSLFLFAFWLLPFLYCGGASKTYSCLYFHYVIYSHRCSRNF